MKILLRLSAKKAANGMQEILMTAKPVVQGERKTIRVKSEVFINAAFFDSQRDNGIMSLTRKLKNEEVLYHIEAGKKINELMEIVGHAIDNVGSAEELSSSWLQEVVGRHNHPERYIPEAEKPVSFYEQMEKYIEKHPQHSKEHLKGIRAVVRSIARYEGFVRATENKDFAFDANTITKDTIEDWVDYVQNERALSEEHPALFERLLTEYPAIFVSGRNYVGLRGGNTIIKYKKRLKAILNWLNEEGMIDNHPFDGLKIGCAKVGAPCYISIDELTTIANAAMPTKHLEVQRDIFVFQCSVGCRVSDLYRLTEKNINNGILEYVPHKTRNEGLQGTLARVPLTERALGLVRKYRGLGRSGLLFPFVSQQRYNDGIKSVFTECGITRNVTVRSPLTGEDELRPINEIASSHMARRTFVGNLYFSVQDPNLIGSMSGHVEGSTAFSRYRKIEDQTLRKVIGAMEI